MFIRQQQRSGSSPSPPLDSPKENPTTTTSTSGGNGMKKSASMLSFYSEKAVKEVQGLSKRGLDLPVTPRLQRRRYR